MFNYPTYFGSEFIYALLFCEKCKRFTTHRTPTPQGSGTFNLEWMSWECLECLREKKEKEKIFQDSKFSFNAPTAWPDYEREKGTGDNEE